MLASAGGPNSQRRTNRPSINSSATTPSVYSLAISQTQQVPLHSFRPPTHIPFMFDAPEDPAARNESRLPLGVLRGHIARKNPHAISLIAACSLQEPSEAGNESEALDREVTILFTPPSSPTSPPRSTHARSPSTEKSCQRGSPALCKSMALLNYTHPPPPRSS
jgi:hypothetical protein